jgi:hypothetical protein
MAAMQEVDHDPMAVAKFLLRPKRLDRLILKA